MVSYCIVINHLQMIRVYHSGNVKASFHPHVLFFGLFEKLLK
jgi:hypothetical protein